RLLGLGRSAVKGVCMTIGRLALRARVLVLASILGAVGTIPAQADVIGYATLLTTTPTTAQEEAIGIGGFTNVGGTFLANVYDYPAFPQTIGGPTFAAGNNNGNAAAGTLRPYFGPTFSGASTGQMSAIGGISTHGMAVVIRYAANLSPSGTLSNSF